MSKILTFRVPVGWGRVFTGIADQYHFASLGEMIRFVLTEATYNALRGKKVKKVNVGSSTEVMSCRVPVNLLEAITGINSKQMGDSNSVWAASAVFQWHKDLQKEINKQQRKNMYAFFLTIYARRCRHNINVYNTNMGIEGLKERTVQHDPSGRW